MQHRWLNWDQIRTELRVLEPQVRIRSVGFESKHGYESTFYWTDFEPSIKNYQNESFLTFFDRKKSAENDQKSKHGHEMHQYWSFDDNFGVVGKLRVPAFQRHQARRNLSSRRSIRDHVSIFFAYTLYNKIQHLFL